MIREFAQACRGKWIWKHIDRKYRADLYIMMPHENEEYNHYALVHLEELIHKRKAAKTLILTYDPLVREEWMKMGKNSDIQLRFLPEKKIASIIRYYALYEFTNKLKIISLTKPYNTCGENLLGVKGVTKEALLCYDIYQLDCVPAQKGREGV